MLQQQTISLRSPPPHYGTYLPPSVADASPEVILDFMESLAMGELARSNTEVGRSNSNLAVASNSLALVNTAVANGMTRRRSAAPSGPALPASAPFSAALPVAPPPAPPFFTGQVSTAVARPSLWDPTGMRPPLSRGSTSLRKKMVPAKGLASIKAKGPGKKFKINPYHKRSIYPVSDDGS